MFHGLGIHNVRFTGAALCAPVAGVLGSLDFGRDGLTGEVICIARPGPSRWCRLAGH